MGKTFLIEGDRLSVSRHGIVGNADAVTIQRGHRNQRETPVIVHVKVIFSNLLDARISLLQVQLKDGLSIVGIDGKCTQYIDGDII